MTKSAICFNRCLVVTFKDGKIGEFVLAGPSKTMLVKAIKKNNGWVATAETIGQIPDSPYTIFKDEMHHAIRLLQSKGLKPKYYSWAKSI